MMFESSDTKFDSSKRIGMRIKKEGGGGGRGRGD